VLTSLVACASPQQKTADNAQLEKAAAQEVRRVCDLPPAEREAELQKINSESGIEVFCGSD
jgi:hypothetical protein